MRKRWTLIIVIFIIFTLGFYYYYHHSRGKYIQYAVYYSEYVTDLSRFDLVIVPPTYNESDVLYLRSKDVIVLGYISISTIGGWEPWAKNVTGDMIIGRYELWNESIINVSLREWQDIVVWAVKYMIDNGYSGVFFDNLDMVDLYPWMNDSIIRIIKNISSMDIVIAVNRGFNILKYISDDINYVLYESFGTTYDFEKGIYRKLNEDEMKELRQISTMLVNLRKEHKFEVLALGYANLTDPIQLAAFEKYVNDLAIQYDFIPYVGDIYLNKLNLDYAE